MGQGQSGSRTKKFKANIEKLSGEIEERDSRETKMPNTGTKRRTRGKGLRKRRCQTKTMIMRKRGTKRIAAITLISFPLKGDSGCSSGCASRCLGPVQDRSVTYFLAQGVEAKRVKPDVARLNSCSVIHGATVYIYAVDAVAA